MKYAIIYSSKTGNTKLLAETLYETLPHNDCIYFGEQDDRMLSAQRLYIGFWTDKGTCDIALADFLSKVHNKEIFLFGTAGFGGEASYFETILKNVKQNIDESNTIIGTYMCQGKMPMFVRERYEKMLAAPDHAPNLQAMIDNFDKALSHPNENDLDNLKCKIASLL